jgi:hypothetical protein
MSIYLKLAPGIKIRIGRRGRTRWSLGPRLFRLRTGSGYPSGVSTGAGPFTWYESLRRRRGRR